MGFFTRKKADRELLKNESFEWMTVGEAVTKERLKSGTLTYNDILQRCEECCEQYSDALNRKNEIQRELSNVDSYFNDVVLIDELSEPDRVSVENMTKNLVSLVEERTRFEASQQDRIATKDYLMMERHEAEIPASLEVLKEQEALLTAAKNDMDKLEREKDRLEDDLEQLKGKRVFYKQLTLVAIAALVLILCVLTVLASKTEADLSLVFMLTIFFGAVLAAAILFSYRKNNYDTQLTGKKINKAIKLTNSAKIKYVNSTNAIDFTCDKYQVDGYRDLAYLWQTYCEVKEEREKYKKNGGKIDELSEALARALTGLGVATPEVLVCQPECIINHKERVELRHRLNERRRVIRDRLDFARVRCESTKSELTWMMSQFPEHAKVFENLMRSYGLYDLAPTEGHETT